MVQVNDDYVIAVDPLNYTVKRDAHKTRIVKDKDTGEEKEVGLCVTVGYVGDLAGAIKLVIKDMNKRELSEGIHDLKSALAIVKRNNDSFEELLRQVTTI